RRRAAARGALAREPAARAPLACDRGAARLPRVLGRVRVRAAPPGDAPLAAAAALLPDRLRTSGAGERGRGDHARARARDRARAGAGAPRRRPDGQRPLMAGASFRGVGRRFGEVVALVDFTLEVAD